MNVSAPVTQADRRMAEILASAKQAFTEKGFDGASMQDLARAAGMSVGNFYRYFKSKDAIVAALIEQDITEVSEKFEAIVSARDPLTALRATLRMHLDACVCETEGALWAEIEAAARRRPEIAAISHKIEERIIDYLVQVMCLAAAPGIRVDEAEARHAATIMVLIVKAVGMQTPRADHHHLADRVMRIFDDLLARTIQRPLPQD